MEGYYFSPPNIVLSVNSDKSAYSGLNFTAYPKTYSISGSIVKVDGNGFPGVAVKLTGSTVMSTVTDNNGYYGFSGVSNGSYTVTPAMAAVSPSSLSVDVGGADIGELNFTATGYAISGKVTSSNGIGVPGVHVILGGAASSSVITDANGYYTLTGRLRVSIPYTITPSMAGYRFEPAMKTESVCEAGGTERNFTAMSVWIDGDGAGHFRDIKNTSGDLDFRGFTGTSGAAVGSINLCHIDSWAATSDAIANVVETRSVP